MTMGIETGTGGLWISNQSALGTQALTSAASTLRLRKATDDTLKSGKTHGREAYVDGAAYDSSTPYVDMVAGDVGQFVFQSQIETGAAAIARHVGADVVTGASDPWTHTIATGTTNPVNETIREKTGIAVGPYRAVWWDAILNKLTINCGHDQNVKHIAAAIQCLKAAEIGSLTDPVAVDSGTDPWRWGEAATAVTIGATPFPEFSGETIEMDRAWTTKQGDNIEPIFFVPGRGAITRAFDGAVTDTLLPQLQLALYGNTAPSVGTRTTSQPSNVALKTVYTRSATRTITYDTPKVEVKPDDIVIGTKPQGGLTSIAFGGQALAGGSPMMTVTALTGQSTSYIT
ncbi:MAG TPA: hypothetical protein VFG87_15210 [Amycolatopsis sp.]|jgi:hypothetical protein|nr:hypothetical protein [Amycolatopsis sp.]